MEGCFKQEKSVFPERTSTKQQIPVPVPVPVPVETNSSERDNRNNILSPLSRVKCEIVEYETPIRDSHSPALDLPPDSNPNNSDKNMMVNLPPQTILKSEYDEINCSESNTTFNNYHHHGHSHSDNDSDNENDNECDPFADIECGVEPLVEQCPQNNVVSPTSTPSPTLCSSDYNATKLLDEEYKLTFLKCPLCPYSCSDAFGLKWHLRNHSSNPPVSNNPMPFLPIKFHYPNQNVEHKLSHSAEADPGSNSNCRPFSCSQPNCTKTFKSKGALNRHLKLHSASLPYVCPETNCGKRFKLRQYLSEHASRVHPSYITSTRPSNTLTLTSTSTSTLTSKPYKCTQPNCGKSFKTRRYLKQHSASHSDCRPFQCSQQNCTKAFKFKGDLKRHHNSSHSDIMPFICPETHCGRGFKLKQNLNDHFLNAHSGNNKVVSRSSKFQSNVNNTLDNSSNLPAAVNSNSDKSPLPIPTAIDNNNSELKKSPFSFMQSLRGPVSSSTSKAKSGSGSGNTMMMMEEIIPNSKSKIMEENKYLKKPFQCPVCQLSFHGAFLLTHHLKSHADNKEQTTVKKIEQPSLC